MAGPWLPAALMVAGGGVQAYSMYQQGQAEKAEAKYAASAEEINARAATAQAEFEAAKQKREARRVIGSLFPMFAANEVSVNSGSAEDIARDTASQLELDRQLTLYRGEIEAKSRYRSAMLQRAAGKNRARSATLGAFGTLVSSVAGAASVVSQSRMYGDLMKAPKAVPTPPSPPPPR